MAENGSFRLLSLSLREAEEVEVGYNNGIGMDVTRILLFPTKLSTTIHQYAIFQ